LNVDVSQTIQFHLKGSIKISAFNLNAQLCLTPGYLVR
jgi:hypothetical protein